MTVTLFLAMGVKDLGYGRRSGDARSFYGRLGQEPWCGHSTTPAVVWRRWSARAVSATIVASDLRQQVFVMLTTLFFAFAILAVPVILVLATLTMVGSLLAALADEAVGLLRPRHI
jgi:hypothetical protein